MNCNYPEVDCHYPGADPEILEVVYLYSVARWKSDLRVEIKVFPSQKVRLLPDAAIDEVFRLAGLLSRFPLPVSFLHAMAAGTETGFDGFPFGLEEHPVDWFHALSGIATKRSVDL